MGSFIWKICNWVPPFLVDLFILSKAEIQGLLQRKQKEISLIRYFQFPIFKWYPMFEKCAVWWFISALDNINKSTRKGGTQLIPTAMRTVCLKTQPPHTTTMLSIKKSSISEYVLLDDDFLDRIYPIEIEIEDIRHSYVCFISWYLPTNLRCWPMLRTVCLKTQPPHTTTMLSIKKSSISEYVLLESQLFLSQPKTRHLIRRLASDLNKTLNQRTCLWPK
jgi:hypothetical protein